LRIFYEKVIIDCITGIDDCMNAIIPYPKIDDGIVSVLAFPFCFSADSNLKVDDQDLSISLFKLENLTPYKLCKR